MIPQEAIGLAGLAVLGFTGERVLKSAGQTELAQYLSITVTAAGSVILVRMIWEAFHDIIRILGVYL